LYMYVSMEEQPVLTEPTDLPGTATRGENCNPQRDILFFRPVISEEVITQRQMVTDDKKPEELEAQSCSRTRSNGVKLIQVAVLLLLPLLHLSICSMFLSLQLFLRVCEFKLCSGPATCPPRHRFISAVWGNYLGKLDTLGHSAADETEVTGWFS
ncbi:unnamed protein product, partial [Pleuronectes platessa]